MIFFSYFPQTTRTNKGKKQNRKEPNKKDTHENFPHFCDFSHPLSSFLIGVFPFFSFLSSLFSSLSRNTDFFYKDQSHNIYDNPFFYFFFFIFFPTPLFRIPYIFSDFLNLMTKPFKPFYALSFCLKRVKVSYSLKNTQNSNIIIMFPVVHNV